MSVLILLAVWIVVAVVTYVTLARFPYFRKKVFYLGRFPSCNHEDVVLLSIIWFLIPVFAAVFWIIYLIPKFNYHRPKIWRNVEDIKEPQIEKTDELQAGPYR